MLDSMQSALGLVVLTGIAWALSEQRSAISWGIVRNGLLTQFIIALALLKVTAFQDAFAILNSVVVALVDATRTGTSFVFGYIGGGEAPFVMLDETRSTFVLAFESLPLILVISAISGLLFHWKVLPPIVNAFAWALQRMMGVNGPVGMAVTLNVFVGQTEAPILVRPYLKSETRAGLFVIMTAGMGTVAGSVMLLYVTFLDGIIPNPLGHILTASLISAPAAIMVALLMIPESPSDTRKTSLTNVELPSRDGGNAMSAITRGTLEGVQLVINIVAMLIVLVALVALANMVIGLLPDVNNAPLTLQRILGWLMAPVAWLIGIPWSEAVTAGSLLGTKTILNELIAYIELSQLPSDMLSARSRLILTYAMCGFANLASIGIGIGALATMVPERRTDIIDLMPRALVSGTITTLLTGAMVGVISG
ncbi:MAG: NupC/NupG family nucleoside CNT transporter [Rhodospirillaceae bacterium]